MINNSVLVLVCPVSYVHVCIVISGCHVNQFYFLYHVFQMTHCLGFLQRDKMSYNKWLFYMCATGCVVCANLPFLLVELYWMAMGSPPTLPQLMGKK